MIITRRIVSVTEGEAKQIGSSWTRPVSKTTQPVEKGLGRGSSCARSPVQQSARRHDGLHDRLRLAQSLLDAQGPTDLTHDRERADTIWVMLEQEVQAVAAELASLVYEWTTPDQDAA